MTAALEVARHGVPVVLLEAKPQLEHEGSRAIVLARHALETFVRLGAGEEMLARAVVLERGRTYFRDRELFCVEYPPPAPGELPRFVNLQQTHTERALLGQVEASPLVETRWSERVTGLRQDDARVVLELEGGGEVAAPYAIGCDGARSSVRALAEIGFPGKSFADRFLITDIRADLPFPNERRFYFDPPWNPGRQVLIHPQPDGEWRLDWQVPPDTDADEERRSGRLGERVRTIVGDAPYELAWVTSYRFHERLAERFRAGRVFLAGDAAHLVAPFGARGLNSGVEDAANLAWKLAFVLQGCEPVALLDTYERERRAAARANVAVTSATMRFMAPPTRARRRVRNAILRGSLHSARVRRLVDSGSLAEPAVYGGARWPIGRRVALPAGTGHGTVEIDGAVYRVRPDGYVESARG